MTSTSPERPAPPAAPGHVWRHCLASGVAQPVTHQFPAEQGPDDEDMMTALCEHEVMANRVLVDDVKPPFCVPCILVTGRLAAAEQDAERDRVRARYLASCGGTS